MRDVVRDGEGGGGGEHSINHSILSGWKDAAIPSWPRVRPFLFVLCHGPEIKLPVHTNTGNSLGARGRGGGSVFHTTSTLPSSPRRNYQEKISVDVVIRYLNKSSALHQHSYLLHVEINWRNQRGCRHYTFEQELNITSTVHTHLLKGEISEEKTRVDVVIIHLNKCSTLQQLSYLLHGEINWSKQRRCRRYIFEQELKVTSTHHSPHPSSERRN
jgi:hypothetical protein